MAEVEVESKQEPNEIQANSEGSPKRAKSKSRSGSPSPHRSRSPHSRSSRSPSPEARRRNSSPQRREQQPHAPPTKTLFVRGVPSSVPDADVIDLFKREQGYADLRRIRNNVIFVDYDTVENASSALKNLQGYKFQGAYRGIHIDFDRRKNTNSDRKRKFSPHERNSGQDEYPASKRKRSASPNASSPRNNSPDDDRRSGSPNRRGGSPRRRSPRRSPRHSSTPRRSASNDRYNERSRSRERSGRRRRSDQGYPSSRSSNNMPHHPHHGSNSTLFVSNLPSDVTEKEISMVFRAALGRHRHLFKDVRIIPKDKARPIAFVDFEDSHIAGYAMDSLQGFKLDTKSSSSIQIEFDRKSGSSSRR